MSILQDSLGSAAPEEIAPRWAVYRALLDPNAVEVVFQSGVPLALYEHMTRVIGAALLGGEPRVLVDALLSEATDIGAKELRRLAGTQELRRDIYNPELWVFEPMPTTETP